MQQQMSARGGRWARVLKGQPAALELLVGQDAYGDTLRRVAPLWMLAVLGGSLVGTLVASAPTPGFHRAAVAVVIGAAIAGLVLPLYLWTRLRRPEIGLWTTLTAISGAILFAVVVALVGPDRQDVTVYLPASAAGLFLFTSRRTATLGMGLALAGYVVVVLTQVGYPDPVSRALVVGSFTIPTSWLMAWTVRHVERLAAQERQAAARVAELAGELKEVNRVLEDRVSAQVAEIERLGRLRRFLSPQVADMMLTSRDDRLLEPHRRQIAVFFCDLRGFTTFTSGAEPEEVVEALDAYFTIVGGVLQRHDATIGMLAGDGIMAYLNDPVACDDPPGTAVEMALAVRERMTELMTAWRHRGFELGYGIGIAYGYATLGTVGFEGRSDYTALGSVVNLAARLCSEAEAGQILVDGRTASRVRDRFRLAERQVTVRGFPGPMRVCEVTGEGEREGA